MRDKRKMVVGVQIGFVLILLAVLSLPIYLGSTGGEPASNAASSPLPWKATLPAGPHATTEPAAEGPNAGGPYPRRVTFPEAYPKRCLRRVERPRPGLVAAFDGGRVSIAAPGTGRAARSFAARPPLQWSPSGRHLLTGRGDVVSIPERGRFRPWGDDATLWAWSPVADCPIAAKGETLTLGRPAVDEPAALVEGVGRVLDMWFSPDGKRLAFVASRAPETKLHLWIAHLDDEVALLAHSFPPGAVVLMGWSDDENVYFGQAPGASIAADGVFLQSTRREPDDEKGVRRQYRFTTLGNDLESCGDRDLLVVGGGRETNANKRLALAPRRGGEPDYLTPRGFAYTSPSCSPDGSFLIAARGRDGAKATNRRLALLESDGTLLRVVTPPGADQPTWGPPGTGVVYLQQKRGGASLYYAPLGGKQKRLPLRVASRPDAHGRRPAGIWDWSADDPTGAPPR